MIGGGKDNQMSGYLRRYVYQSWHGPISNRHDIKHRLLRIIHPHAHETLRSGKPRGHSHSPSDPRRIQCQSHLLFLMKLKFNRSATKLQAISLANRHSMPYLRWFEGSSLICKVGFGGSGMGWDGMVHGGARWQRKLESGLDR